MMMMTRRMYLWKYDDAAAAAKFNKKKLSRKGRRTLCQLPVKLGFSKQTINSTLPHIRRSGVQQQ